MIEIEGKQFKNKRSVSNHFRWRIKTGLNSSFPECYEQFSLLRLYVGIAMKESAHLYRLKKDGQTGVAIRIVI